MNQVTPIYQGKIASHPAIAFIDPAVENYQQLVAGVIPGIQPIVLDRDRDRNWETAENLLSQSEEGDSGSKNSDEVLAKGNQPVQRVIFLDESIPDLEFLAKHAIAGSEIAIVNRHSDGIRQVSNHLKNYSYPVEVHLVCHGSPGSLDFGSNGLRLDNIDAYRHDLQAWNISTLVLYGCNVAAGDAGSALIEKLQQFTNAKIAASTTKIGSSALGGNWTLDVSTHYNKPELAFHIDGLNAYRFAFPTPMDNISANGEDLSGDSDDTFSSESFEDGDTKNFDFQVGNPNNRKITEFEANLNSYNFVDVLDKIEIQRVDNSQVTGKQQLLWFEKDDSSSDPDIKLRPTFFESMEEALLGRTLNRGTDNLFTNQGDGSGNNNNIERVDFISTKGISAPSASDVGFSILERGSGDNFKIAAITGIDESGNANSFGKPIEVTSSHFSGASSPLLLDDQLVMRKEPNDTDFRESVNKLDPKQDIVGTFISYDELGIDNGDTFYGYSIFGNDVNDGDVANLSAYPTDTTGSGLDLVGSGSVFAVDGTVLPPTIDLDDDDSSGATGTGYQTTWTEGDGGVAIGDSDVAIADDSSKLKSATIQLTSRPDGDSVESLSVSGTLPTAISAGSYDETTGTLTLTENATENASLADYQNAIAQIQYNNTSDNPKTSDRSVEVTVTDSDDNQSNIATTTIQISPTNDPPQIETNTGTSVEVGSSVPITNSELNEGDPDDDGDELTYEVTETTNNGTLFLDENSNGTPDSGEELENGDTFTQTDIDDGKLAYQHDGSETPNTDSFDFSLADGGEDGATPVTDTFDFTINEVNDLPVIDSDNFALNENSPPGTVVGTLTATDAENQPLQDWTINNNPDPDGDGTPAFAINPETGEITVNDQDDLDFENTPNFDLEVQVSDGQGKSNPQTIPIQLNNVSDPTVDPDQNFAIDENSSEGTPVGQVTATSQDDEPLQDWKIQNNPDPDGDGTPAFTIDPNTGEIIVGDQDDLDFEETPSFDLQVQVSDGTTFSDPETVTVKLNDVVDPSINPDQVFEIFENSEAGTSVGSVQATDQDNDPLQDWQISGGNVDVDGDGNSAFAIAPDTGKITVNDQDDVDFENTPSFDLQVQVSDGKQTSDPGRVTVNLKDVSDPEVDPNQAFNLNENSPKDTVVGTVTGSTTDGSLQDWTIKNNPDPDGDGTPAFSIDPDTGEIVVNDQGDLDFETQNSFDLQVQVSDGTKISDPETVTVNLNDVSDPSVNPNQTFAVDENSSEGTSVGQVVATTTDDEPLQDWTIKNNPDPDGDGTPAFSINPDTGEIVVNDQGDLDFESNSSFDLQVQVGDGTKVSDPQKVTVNLNDVSNPTVDSGQSFDVDENSSPGTPVGQVTGTNPEGGLENWQFANNPDPDGDSTPAFSINSETGEITVNDRDDLDFENIPSFDLQVQVGDGDTTSSPQTVTVNLNDLAETSPEPANNPPSIDHVDIEATPDADGAIALDTQSFTDVYSDPENSPLGSIRIDSLPENGTLFLGGEPVTAGQAIASADIGKVSVEPDSDFTGTLEFDWNASDGERFALFGKTFSIDVGEPVTIDSEAGEDVETPFNTAIALEDIAIDASQNGNITTTLSTNNGTLTLGTTNGLTFTQGDGDGDPQMVFSGSEEAVNTALASLTFTPNDGFVGEASLEVTGSSGTATDTDSINIQVLDSVGGDIHDDCQINITIPAVPQLPPDAFTGFPSIDRTTGIETDETITGSDSDDVLLGNASRNELQGGLGNDFLLSNQEDDFLIGGEGDDTFHAGRDRDLALGEAGNDTMLGDMGDDSLSGGEGDDALTGGNGSSVSEADGNDLLVGDGGQDLLFGNRGNDTLLSGTDDDTLRGGRQDDWLVAGSGDDVAFGELGNDSLSGGEGNDVLTGSNGSTLTNTDGDDLLVGDGGEDVLFGNRGNDTLFGGEGDDTLHSGRQDDWVIGESGNDVLFGELGNDSLSGGEGNDALTGSNGSPFTENDGSDLLLGNEGEDTVFGNRSNDTLFGGEGNDLLHGGRQDDLVVGNAGDDVAFGELGDDSLFGKDGDDTLVGDNAGDSNAHGNDFICAGIGDDLAFGSQGMDSLYGGDGNDTLFGGEDGDTLLGDAGNDILLGDVGNDWLFGGEGSDDFVLSATTGVDTIEDFTDGVDAVALAGGLQFSQLTVTETDTGATIALGEQILANLLGVQANNLTEEDFREFSGL
jgi:Ca2+-binding RTX toxin-like protein